MCKGRNYCTELGTDPTKWSRECPLPPPPWFSDQVVVFRRAARSAAEGALDTALKLLHKVRGEDLREWYDRHGQNTGKFRYRDFGERKARIVSCERDAQKYPNALEETSVFRHDGYRCQYCGMRVIAKDVFQAFSRVVGEDEFRATGTNKTRHGVVLAYRAIADHVVPRRVGGRTCEDNLVTACWSCNYGKAEFTLEQLGLDDPRLRKLVPEDDWDGLVPLITPLREQARVRQKG